MMIPGKSILYTYQCHHQFQTDGYAKDWKHRDRCPECKAWKSERYKKCVWCESVFPLEGRPSSTKYCPGKTCYEEASSRAGRGLTTPPDPMDAVFEQVFRSRMWRIS